MIKMLVVALGSSLPGYLAWGATGSQSIMVRFWVTLVATAVGWYVSRRFAQNHLDL